MSLQMKSSVGTRLRRAPALFTDVCQDLACGHRRTPPLVADVRQPFVFPGLARDCIACRLLFAFVKRPAKAFFIDLSAKPGKLTA